MDLFLGSSMQQNCADAELESVRWFRRREFAYTRGRIEFEYGEKEQRLLEE